ncbi:MAG: hypothetical protein M1825_005912 [Sarcosagium campestre]|nr:MAG: hypothetical protein M1825_005912 [Sarcosagium campestre]
MLTKWRAVPRFLRRHAEPLRSAPITHVSAFLVLHELTAILPLFTLAATFHYTQWLPPFVSEWKWVSQGVEKFGRYFQRKGWLGQEERSRYKWWQRGEGGVRIVVEFATAYALTKALLPLRLIFSVWATPWFARVSVVPFVKLLKRTFGNKSKVAPKSGAAGTGATEGGVLAKGRMDSKRTTAPPVKGKGAGSV